jgi:glycosyltransferase involved in cell wall biosynthesis
LKNIYFYLPDYPDSPTGGIKYHNLLYEYFLAKRENVYLLGNNRFSKLIDKSKILKFLSGIVYSFKVPRSSVIVLSNTAFLHFLLPQYISRIIGGIKYFMIVHHLIRNENPEFFRSTFEKKFISNADSVVTISKATLNDMLKNGIVSDPEIPIVPPGLKRVLSNVVPKEYKNKCVKLLYAGTIEERKGLVILIEALTKLKKYDFVLTIAGDTSKFPKYSDSLMKMLSSQGIEDRVRFAGRVSDSELAGLYVETDIFVFPSFWEGYGMVVAEAMSAGVPSVASRLPSLEGLLEDGVNGLYFNTGDANDLAEKLGSLMSNEKLLASLSLSAYEKSLTLKSWDETCERIFNLVEATK